jgi:predicted nucleic acid-binding protein
MTVPYFLDTNILIYAASKDDARKRKIASSLIEAGEFGVSAQVLGEFYNTATLKMRETMTPDQAEAWIDLLLLQQCEALNAELVKSGVRVARRYGISYWDGAIVAAAEALGAPILYTEDLNHGQAYGTVTAINPFIDSVRAEGFHDAPAKPLEGSP